MMVKFLELVTKVRLYEFIPRSCDKGYVISFHVIVVKMLYMDIWFIGTSILVHSSMIVEYDQSFLWDLPWTTSDFGKVGRWNY